MKICICVGEGLLYKAANKTQGNVCAQIPHSGGGFHCGVKILLGEQKNK